MANKYKIGKVGYIIIGRSILKTKISKVIVETETDNNEEKTTARYLVVLFQNKKDGFPHRWGVTEEEFYIVRKDAIAEMDRTEIHQLKMRVGTAKEEITEKKRSLVAWKKHLAERKLELKNYLIKVKK